MQPESDQTPNRTTSRKLHDFIQRWGPLRLGLVGAGIALVVLSSSFLLVSAGGEGPRATSAAPDFTPTPPLTIGDALGELDAATLQAEVFRLAVALLPTPTPTATPTATPQPTAAPQQPPAPPVSDPDPTSPPPSGCPTAAMSGYALALFNAANAERTSRGLPALAAHGCVVFVAQLRSEDMAAKNYFSHTSPTGQTAFSLMDQYGVPYGWAGENLARNNYPDSEAVGIAIRDLMASQGHRENILSTNYTHLGIGFAEDGSDMKYFTMVFIGPP